ncbi:Leucine Rich Repeat [Seminavis robusta]|uniref:Leucine Rich Repeat n=1 Tax=Seminavis robusta TaxID=568900 RepID=A0A9N8DJ54_9STRA|nr:Leucine Rich Repeat [Seminavis robusta]|eukprot:Sro186_g080700.1 Leucine Rich Repeat (640) ;mRNA; f:58360-60279
MKKETETKKRTTHQHEEAKEEEEFHVDQPVQTEHHRQAVVIHDEAKNQNYKVKDTNNEISGESRRHYQNHKVKDTNVQVDTSGHHDGESRHVYQLYQKDRILRDKSRREYHSDEREKIVRHVLGEDIEDGARFHRTVEKDLVREGRTDKHRVLVAKEWQHPEDDSGGYVQGQQSQRPRKNTISQVGAFAVEGIGVVEERSSGVMNNNSNHDNSEAVIDGAVLVDNDTSLADKTVFMEEGTSHKGNKEEEEVIEGTIMQNSDVQSNVYPWLGLAFLAVTGLVVFLALYLPSTSSSLSVGSNSSQTVHDAANNSPIIYPPFQDDLLTSTLKAILNTSTPAYLANAWIWNDPNFANYSHERQRQRFDLAYWYYATNGHNWFRNDYWLSYNINECDWFTQAHNESILHYDNYPVCDENNTLLIFNLNSNNLQGTLPIVNGVLTNILTFDVGNNQLHGAVPAGAAATNEVLEVFIVSNNNFEGQLTSSGGFRPFGIRIIKLDGNFLLGYMDPLHKYLTKLEIVNASSNLFGLYGGKLSETFNSKSLFYYGNADNLLTGTIPTALGVLPALETIDFHGNPGLFGMIPTELGELTNLTLLDLSYTNVSGPVPTTLCDRVGSGLLEIRANCSLVDCCSVSSPLPNRS